MKKSLGVSRINYEFTVCFGNFFMNPSLSFSRIYNIFGESTMNLLGVSGSDYKFTIFLENLLWIHCRFREFTMHSFPVSRIRCLFFEKTMNSLSVSQIHYEFSIFFANISRIHLLFREFIIYYANFICYVMITLNKNNNVIIK